MKKLPKSSRSSGKHDIGNRIGMYAILEAWLMSVAEQAETLARREKTAQHKDHFKRRCDNGTVG